MFVKKTFNLKLLKYELRNLTGNIFVLIFGVLFPIFFTIFFDKTINIKVPDEIRPTVSTTMFITSSMIVPLATTFIGYAAIFSQELEKEIPLRLRLFGYSDKIMVITKIIANLITLTGSLIIYTGACLSVIKIKTPVFSSVIIWLISIYTLCIFLFILAHGIALFVKKFGTTYAITMTLYFGIMIVSGMFGIQVKDFPPAMKQIAHLFPTSYISSDFVEFWSGGAYNFAPFIQSFLSFGAVSFIVLFSAIYFNREKYSGF